VRARAWYGRRVSDTDLARVRAYHERSKHRPGRYAAALGYLDWDTQPDPFRVYRGAETLALPRRPLAPGPDYPALFEPRAITPAPLDTDFLDALLLHSLALSAWKQQGAARWSLRVNPSSGNLHPTEAYVLAPALAGLSESPGLYHYSPLLHALERRAAIPAATWDALGAGLPHTRLLVGLTSIAWREAWKYGERAFRYCQHDLGHAVAAIDLAAALLGWRALELPRPGDAQLRALLGLRDDDEDEPELPETLLILAPSDMSEETDPIRAWTPPPAAIAWFAAAPLAGTPNRLSAGHEPWPAIVEVEHATRRPDHDPTPAADPNTAASPIREPDPNTVPPPADRTDPSARPTHGPDPGAADVAAHDPVAPRPAAALIRGRRSAVAMDGRTGLTRSGFYDMLLRTCPEGPPLRALAGPARVDLALFVHRVADLEPGLYLLLRDPARRGLWRASADAEFAWTRPDGCPAALDLSLLRGGDGRRTAGAIACGQAIAADGCFALGMIANMRGLDGAPYNYRRLYWETGAIGQILYLEAEALGVAATGIGCFFDDRMHELLGLHGPDLQSLYHFTVGGRVDDPRLRTLDPYHHLDR